VDHFPAALAARMARSTLLCGMLLFAACMVHGAGLRIEERDAAVAVSAGWSASDPQSGWSGGAAIESATAGATVTVSFTGSSIRWIGSRGRRMGIALVRVDGGPAREVDLFGRPVDEVHTVITTLHGLSDGPHTLTIEVTGRSNSQAEGENVVVVDAFDVQPGTTISHWQDTDPDAHYSAGWTKSDLGLPWSGNGVSNLPELPVTAQETQTAGASMTIPFRGTEVAWIGYLGPDAGIAQVQIDGGVPSEVDLYAASPLYQPVVFAATGLTDTNHTLTIEATGRMNPAATAARVVVDAFDITTPGRRYEEVDASITYAGSWTGRNDARVWSGGAVNTSNSPGSTATFSFSGTSVSWIGCRKGSAGGDANVYIDGTFVRLVRLSENYPIEGYQKTVFRADGLADGPHTLTIEVVNTNGAYVVVDAFDVHAGAGANDRTSAPSFTSAAGATFTVGAGSSFNVTAFGDPPPTLSLSGTLPAGVAFTASTGAIAGTPASGTAASYTVTLRATNGISPDAVQAFTLVVARAAQSIAFGPLPDRNADAPPFQVSASASSGLPVGFSSLTPAVCSVDGATVSLLATGTCTVAADQPGDADFSAAPRVSRSFSVNAAASRALRLAPTSLDFGLESMGTSSAAQAVTLSNVGSGTIDISSVTLGSGEFTQANDCASLAPGASCTVRVVFSPAVAAGELNAMRPVSTTLTVASNAEGAPHTASLAGTGHKSLVSHYYRTILGRAPDAGGLDFWQRETARLADLGADVNEAWFAMARSFFASPEYAASAGDDATFVTGLYRVFFNREADAAGLDFWTGELRNGLPRDIVLVTFMLSPEFRSFTESVFGPQQVRAETRAVMDFYRGLLSRLPDDSGYGFWVQRFRAAQCHGAEAVHAEADAISQSFAQGPEYAGRQRTNAQYVADLYDAMLRRGGEREGVAYWIDQLDRGAQSREDLRKAFLASPEFSARVNAIAGEGCMP
jgi:hypothetical protein